jgi:anti-anti-sigma regulatory factor
MTTEHPSRRGGSAKAEKTRVTRNQKESDRSPAPIDVERSGGWMPPEELREAALAALSANVDVALNLHGIDHLDASALQIFLALDVEQKKRNRNLQLINASPRLRQWFEFAGVVDLFFDDGAENQ